MRNFDYYMPRAAADALAVRTSVDGAAYKAGGTDLLPLLKSGIRSDAALVNLLPVAALSGIRAEGGEAATAFWIGATTTIADVAAHPALGARARAVADAALATATPLVRSKATVGGNLCQRPRCWYFRHPDYRCSKKGGDVCYTMEGENKYHAIFENTTCNIVHPSNLAPALWAHDAVVHVLGAEGAARDVKIADFWVTPEEDLSTEIVLAPAELVTGVTLAASGPRSGSSYIEVRERQSFDWALVSAAARIDLDGDRVEDLRVVVSAVAPVPLRREAAEAVVRGRPFSEELAFRAGEAAAEGATPLRDNGYKVRMLKNCVAHALLAAHERARAS